MCSVPFYTKGEFFEEEMASMFGDEKSDGSWLTPISANGQYQFLCILPSKVIFQPKIPASSHSTTCACRTRFTFRVELENNSMAFVRE